MAKNSSRPRPHATPQRSTLVKNKRGLFGSIDRLFNMNKVLGGALPVDLLPHLAWGTLLTLVYIGCSNHADSLIRRTEDTRKRIAEKRAEYITLKSSFMKESKQSAIAKRVERLQVKENQVAPLKIVVKTKP